MTERAWSEDTGQADWIGERLSPFDDYVVTSVVPGGFESYARLLHPAEEPGRGGGHLVRWAEVAAWSGLPLRGDSQFHSIALPRVRPAAAAPWSGQGPRVGGLYPPDAEVLAGILRRWTTTPERCWFCAWEDFGQGVSVRLTAAGERPAAPAAAAPEVTWNGPRVHLPDREYLLYAGSVESFVAHTHLDGDEQTASLWWPADRAWCVASEVDLPWTYVAGPADLTGQLVADRRIEVVPAAAEDRLSRLEDWVMQWAEEATSHLLSTGEATITTSRGTIRARLREPGRFRPGSLRTETEADNGTSGSGQRTLGRMNQADLRREICADLTLEIIGLVEG